MLQVYDRNGHKAPTNKYAELPLEVSALQKIFPDADPEALINALAVSENSVETAKAVRAATVSSATARLAFLCLEPFSLGYGSALVHAQQQYSDDLAHFLHAISRCFGYQNTTPSV